MSSVIAKKHIRKPTNPTAATRRDDVASEAANIDFADTRPLTPKMAAAWSRATRGRGRPKVGEGAEKVLISMEKRLRIVTDAMAKRRGLDRSKLIALAIREMLEREAKANQ